MLVCATAGALCACSISPTIGETMSECSDTRDNDEDGMTDCRDPDCQALSECAVAARIRTPVMPGQIEDAYVAEPPDARAPQMPDPVDARTPDEPRDASAVLPDATMEPPAPGCAGGCGANQTCVVDQCVDDALVVLELWDVTRVEVSAPRSVQDNGGNPCLDTVCIFIPTFTFPSCGCAPDPQVQFWVDRDPTDDVEAELAGETSVAETDEVVWPSSGVPAPGVTLRLLPSSEIQVKVVDDDATRDQFMFGCTVAAEVVSAGGPIECKQRFPPSEAGQEFFVRAEVAPTQVEPE